MKQYYTFAQQAYGEGSYGYCTYQASAQDLQECQGTAGGGTGTGAGGTGAGSGGSLVDTGFAIALAITLACLIIFVTLVVRIWRRPKVATQEVQTNHNDEQQRPFRQ